MAAVTACADSPSNGATPRAELEQHDRDRPHVAALVDVARGAHLLGRHVERGADGGLRDGQLRLATDELGDAEVEQDHARGTIGVRPKVGVRIARQEYVVGLDVAMNHVQRVRLGQTRARLTRDPHRLRDREGPAAIQESGKVCPLQELHHEERQPLGSRAHVEHAHHVRVTHACDELSFTREPLANLVDVRHLRAQHLERDALTGRAVVSLVHHAHHAFAADAEKNVATRDGVLRPRKLRSHASRSPEPAMQGRLHV
jgi:hypothetical protein